MHRRSHPVGREIRVLPPELSAKIAAGEVIERPAQAVKELVENSLDAGSADISVEIEKGGKLLIKVIDNGTGMRKEDLALAFSRNATSKILTLSDLEHITTLGFRGEALASLASCSRIEVTSKTEEMPIAAIMKIEGGKETYSGEGARRRGTTIIARDLFYNLPPRRKFLKTDSTEAGHIMKIMSQMAIAHTDIGFSLTMDGDVVFDLPGGLSFERRIGEVYGRELEKELIPLRGEKDGMRISGGILPPTVVRNNRDLQIFVVNCRPVRSPQLAHAINSAFKSLIPSGKFPIAFVLLEVPSEEVDANIHPTKREIKFVRDREVHAFVVAATKLAFHRIRMAEDIPTPYMPQASQNLHAVKDDVEAYLDGIMGPINIVGQVGEAIPCLWLGVKDTYLIMEKEDGIEVIDQHAAHERILYEGLKEDISKGHIEKQALLFPLSLELGLEEALFLRERIDWFLELGIEIEEFGKNTFNVRTLPSKVKTEKAKEFILGVIQELAELGTQKGIADLKDEALKIMACRAAIMAGDKLGSEERMRLIRELDSCKDNFTCPHGRPVRIKLGWSEIEKKFKR
ncbi:MAG: DNA mismatch repair endonuclease MutL [Candidatus Omnitrophica bacterium]|nr:DNA mismatch repair endonuclease MutL [Candidatus Omnitrophota bacterium]